MKHHSSEQWADYVRGTTPQRLRAQMKQHLQAGCKQCEQAVTVWTAVENLAHKEPAYQPPEDAVRIAKSYFAMSRIAANEGRVPRVARLVFDSLRQPLLEGVRSLGTSPRHYVYRAGSLMVDVWLEPATESRPASVTGQVLDQSIASQAVKDMVIKLRSGDADITTAVTNQFGEFHLEVVHAGGKDLQLTIGNDNKIAVIIPLRLIASGEISSAK